MMFELDETLDWHPSIRTNHVRRPKDPDSPTPDELIAILKTPYTGFTVSTDDSPEFKALRNQLEAEGYIQCERGWWNGDRVIKTFFLNGVRFDPDDSFPSGAAMKSRLRIARKCYDD